MLIVFIVSVFVMSVKNVVKLGVIVNYNVMEFLTDMFPHVGKKSLYITTNITTGIASLTPNFNIDVVTFQQIQILSNL